MSAAHLLSKFRRAIRNDTETHFTADELRQLGAMGLLDLLQAADNRELSTKWAEPEQHDPLVYRVSSKSKGGQKWTSRQQLVSSSA